MLDEAMELVLGNSEDYGLRKYIFCAIDCTRKLRTISSSIFSMSTSSFLPLSMSKSFKLSRMEKVAWRSISTLAKVTDIVISIVGARVVTIDKAHMPIDSI